MQRINFGELLTMQLGQIPYTETEKGSTVSVNAFDRTENTVCTDLYPDRRYYMAARRHEIFSSSVENIS